jgi:hypothetical protein
MLTLTARRLLLGAMAASLLIAAMCRSVEQPMLVSEVFANVDGMRGRLVSVVRYALRGVAQPQELFTLDFTQVI